MKKLRLLVMGVSLFLLQATAQRPSFEVVSIRPNHSGSPNGGLGPRGSRLVGMNVTLRTLLLFAYRPSGGTFLDAQIFGEPGWARTEHFDIEAKADGDARIVPGEQTRAMVQSLLEDSFHLKVHQETRELPVYNLTLLKRGPKLSDDQSPIDPRQAVISVVSEGRPAPAMARGGLRMIAGAETTRLSGTGVAIAQVVSMLQSRSDRMIIDKTGLKDLIDVQIEFQRDLSGDAADAAPSLFTAIRDIGLKMEPAKAPTEVLVIEHVERPAI